jgi:hypothetical protein
MTCVVCQDKVAYYVPCSACGYREEFFDGDQAAENASYEFNAQYDAISEMRDPPDNDVYDDGHPDPRYIEDFNPPDEIPF